MSMINKTITGPETLMADLDRLIREYPQVACCVLEDVLEMDIGPETQEQVPRATGDLARTWTVEDAVAEAGRIYIDFGYGMVYGVYVHEIPPPGEGRMNPKQLLKGKSKGAPKSKITGTRTAMHRPPQKWKYLEDPVNMHIDRVPEELLKATDRIFGGR